MSLSPFSSWLDRRFRIGQRGSTVNREILAGLTTFGAMAYIMAVNPAIMTQAGLAPHDMIMTTIAAAVCGTLLMAIFANMPIALAPAMSSNAIFAQIVVHQMHVDVRTAFTIVLLGGVAFTCLSVTRMRHRIIQAFPEPIVLGIQVAIGIFIARIGMVTGKLAVPTSDGFHFGSLSDPSVLLTLFGIFLAGSLLVLRVPAGMLVSILSVTLLSLFVHRNGAAITTLPAQPVDWPHYPTHLLFPFNFGDFFSHLEVLLPITLYFIISDFFDATGTMYSVANRARLTRPDGTTLLGRAAFAADGSASVIGSALGTSTVSAYVESLVGVEAGGRTGLTALVVAVLFAASSVFWPLIVMIPPEATAPVLILVGLGMLSALGQAASASREALLTPAFMLLIAVLTGNFMISLALGLLFYSTLLLVSRQFVRLTPMVLGLDLVFLFYLFLTTRTGLGQG